MPDHSARAAAPRGIERISRDGDLGLAQKRVVGETDRHADRGLATLRTRGTYVGSVRTTMQYYHSVMNRLEQLDFNQVALLVILIVGFGFYCLRGFGSRHNY